MAQMQSQVSENVWETDFALLIVNVAFKSNTMFDQLEMQVVILKCKVRWYQKCSFIFQTICNMGKIWMNFFFFQTAFYDERAVNFLVTLNTLGWPNIPSITVYENVLHLLRIFCYGTSNKEWEQRGRGRVTIASCYSEKGCLF